MSRDEEHGGPGWGFTECLWAPSHKNPSGTWTFWQLLLNVREGDLVFHLRGKTHHAAFIGYSIADADGYETNQRPPTPKDWSYASSYYRVPLRDFVSFTDPISLDDIFQGQEKQLRAYFGTNKARSGSEHQHIFFVAQSNRLQCLNGAYLSEFPTELANIVLGPDFSGNPTQPRTPTVSARTGQQISSAKRRIGQDIFSNNVRENYNHTCCFPGCEIRDRSLLIGAHIVRWADDLEFSGQTSNGLCLCLFHDKAFEIGLFTLTKDYRVSVNMQRAKNVVWAREHLIPFHGQSIRLGPVTPSQESIEKHWVRIGYVAGENR